MEENREEIKMSSIQNLSYSSFDSAYKELAGHNYKDYYQEKIVKDVIKKMAIKEGFTATEANELAGDVTDFEFDINKNNTKSKTRKGSIYSTLNRRYKREVKEEKQENQIEEQQKQELPLKNFNIRFFGKWLAIVGELPKDQAIVAIKNEITSQAFSQGITIEDLDKTTNQLSCSYKGFSKNKYFATPKKLIDALSEEIYVSALVACLRRSKHKKLEALENMGKAPMNTANKEILSSLLQEASREEFAELANHPTIKALFSKEELELIPRSKQGSPIKDSKKELNEFETADEINGMLEPAEVEVNENSNGNVEVQKNQEDRQRAEYANMLGIEPEVAKKMSLEEMQAMLKQFAYTPNSNDEHQ